MSATVSQPCSATNRKTGKPCQKRAIAGGTVCRSHGGNIPAVKAKASMRVAAQRALNLKPGEAPHIDPGDFAQNSVNLSALLTDRYAEEMEAFISEAEAKGIPLRRALVGDIWTTDDDGEGRKQGEYLRGLVTLFNAERDRGMSYAMLLLKAGHTERQVRLQEAQGALIVQILRLVMRDPLLGLSESQRSMVPQLAERYIAEIAG